MRSGIDRYYSDKPFTLKVIPKYTKDSDPDIIERTYEFYRKAGFKRELMISEPGMQEHLGLHVGNRSGSQESYAGTILRRPLRAAIEQRKITQGVQSLAPRLRDSIDWRLTIST